MSGKLALIYCGTGPYRHYRSLILEHRASWVPWGCKASRKLGSNSPPINQDVEIWEVDDVRCPMHALPIVSGRIAYAAQDAAYIHLTVTIDSQRTGQVLSADDATRILERVSDGYLIFSL